MYDISAPLLLGITISALAVWFVPKFSKYDLKTLSGLVGLILGSGVLKYVAGIPIAKALTWYLAGFLLILFFSWALHSDEIK